MAPLTGWNGREHRARGPKYSHPNIVVFQEPEEERDWGRRHTVPWTWSLGTPRPLLWGGLGVSECEETFTEEETEAQRENRGPVLGLVSLRLLPQAFSGSSWVPRGLIAGSGPQLFPSTLLSSAFPFSLLEWGEGADICRSGKGALDWEVGLQMSQSWGFWNAWPSTPSHEAHCLLAIFFFRAETRS